MNQFRPLLIVLVFTLFGGRPLAAEVPTDKEAFTQYVLKRFEAKIV